MMPWCVGEIEKSGKLARFYLSQFYLHLCFPIVRGWEPVDCPLSFPDPWHCRKKSQSLSSWNLVYKPAQVIGGRCIFRDGVRNYYC